MPGVNDAADDSRRQPELLLQQAEACAHSQEGLLFASDGALEFSKCYAYVFIWDLSPSNEHRLLEAQEIPGCSLVNGEFCGPIGLTYGDKSFERHLLLTESPYKGKHTLGARLPSAGDWCDEFKFRCTQINELRPALATRQWFVQRWSFFCVRSNRDFHSHPAMPRVRKTIGRLRFLSKFKVEDSAPPQLGSTNSAMDYLCYRASPGEGFSVFQNSDEDGEEFLEPDDNEVFMVARRGDTLLCPFECDRCAHFKLIGRLAVRHNAADDRILKFVRRANLDALLLGFHEPLYPLLVLLSVLLPHGT
jgi:hypothetical protein